jgi:hypothetical protein
MTHATGSHLLTAVNPRLTMTSFLRLSSDVSQPD